MSETYMSPVAPVRWCKLLEPAPAYDQSKKEYSIDMLLDYANPEHKAFIEAIEKHYTEEHGKNARRSQYAINLKTDKENPDLSILKFKLPAFTDKKGNVTPGPNNHGCRQEPLGRP